MIFRIATIEDIPEIQIVRNSVKENMLSDPALVPDAAVKEYLSRRGKGWVCEIQGLIVGFAIADLQDNNIWALFIHPDNEKKGIGMTLQNLMLDWYFLQNKKFVWLSTGPGTRAEKFYLQSGWKVTGIYGKGETKFEMTKNEWAKIRRKNKR